jgi:hypothetical protein
MVCSAVESVNVFTSWLLRSLLLTSIRFDSLLSTKIKNMNVEKFLESKDLKLSRDMNGYEVTYSYLCKLLQDYAELRVDQANK